ncbi:helix-turn-helix domain-containing protein [Kribbella sp. NPDC004536]|uniref:helix-turn-helix domain-containing protein n=1 Tax=Kribbella sp. NPDC004536 TaxID=3364106 RepID=UPI0036BB0811
MTRTRFLIRDGYARYQGPVAGASRHRHAAYQLAIGAEVTMIDDAGVEHHGPALVVPPMTWHRLLPCTDLLTYFIEPQSVFADAFRTYTTITTLSAPPEELSWEATGAGRVDSRLVAAMELVVAEPGLGMGEVAGRVGLSGARLRAVAREGLGMSLARWRVWARLRRAAEELAAGRSLAEAAVVAGFSDQAHLSRWMREMMGLTPREVLPALRGTPSAPRSNR